MSIFKQVGCTVLGSAQGKLKSTFYETMYTGSVLRVSPANGVVNQDKKCRFQNVSSLKGLIVMTEVAHTG